MISEDRKIGWSTHLIRWTTLMFPMMLVLGVSAAATAQQSNEREIRTDLSESKAVIESERVAENQEDYLKIEFDNGSHNFLLEYESKGEDVQVEANIKAELFDLIEWRDVNDNDLYDPEVVEEMVQKIGLGDLVPQSTESETIQEEGISRVRVVGTTAAPDKYPDLEMVLNLWVYGDFVDLEGTELEPTAMKFDITIRNFPFQRDDTALALYGKVTMDAGGQTNLVEQDEGQKTLAARIDRYISFFSWGDDVTVDGRTTEVGQTVVKHEVDEDEGATSLVSEVYLLYPRGEEIFHDPRLGIRVPGTSAGCNAG